MPGSSADGGDQGARRGIFSVMCRSPGVPFDAEVSAIDLRGDIMQIRARMSMSADGFVTTPAGWPSLTADPAFVSGESHGIREFLDGCEAALMGRTTFEPALTNARWPWPGLDV